VRSKTEDNAKRGGYKKDGEVKEKRKREGRRGHHISGYATAHCNII